MTPPAPDEMAARPDGDASPSLHQAVDVFDTYPLEGAGKAQTLLGWYRALDARAVARQKWHFFLAAVAAIFGLLAIVLVLPQIYTQVAGLFREAARVSGLTDAPDITPPLWMRLLSPMLGPIEVIAMVAAVAAVVVGYIAATHHGWLLDRHKAERLRMLRFRVVTHPANWADRPELRRALRPWLDARVRDIELVQSDRALHQWLEEEGQELPRHLLEQTEWDATGLDNLRNYYVKVRLNSQRDYMTERSKPRGWADRLTRRLPQRLFFVAAGVVFLHYYLERAHIVTARGAIVLLMLAVALPAIGAAIRTLRLSRELDRNAIRAQAKAVALRRLRDQLLEAQDPKWILLTLHACEDVLEADHREWLRLMIEAEWFG